MPLGAIHLISKEPDGEGEAEFYCRASDAIAAIRPDRLNDFPDDVICVHCMKAYQENKPGGQVEQS